ncbi:MAG: ATP-binding cassette domain-containing protein [Alphaproteobacteria bacterium]|jgi:branched-chain amino acid transport system ATP-binding protein|nr:ATP-binding cassette domain-containing protein [Alphaproteobacteria bacterium]MDP6237312.1 ATP-binding cassette domain-containing protein [Alphaproteobacteria bacterium]MDP7172768.1 ATP-binding cassette domain-containing protein [Alphaproteobacteria bacterium]MDP7234478.1 ATP-binding cassette domain-containing protein [Alphaproteobacteria bacterium]
MLSVSDLHVRIAAATILDGVSLDVAPGSLTALMGRNGAGKTTFMRSVMGLIPRSGGSIAFDGGDLGAMPAHARAGLGIGYMPENRRLVPELTVRENILVPAWATRIDDAEDRIARIYALMPEVEHLAVRRAMQLSGGQQKLAALARALMTATKLVLLDEPFEGVAPALAGRLAEVLLGLKEQGLSVLLSESDSTHSEDLIDTAYIIERGRVEARGDA